MSAGPALVFPPLFRGLGMGEGGEPFAKAIAEAALGCDPGLVTYGLGLDRMAAAMVLAPEMPLSRAMAAMIAAGLGFQNALGALAPPEVAVHLTWEGGLRVNGALCGRLRVAASTDAPEQEPDWLVVGLELDLVPPPSHVPGLDPDRTWLSEEGCGEVDPGELVEAWVRHTLWWLNRLEEEGPRRLHEDWRGLCEEIGRDVRIRAGGVPREGLFLGVDEDFGMLLREASGQTQVIGLHELLEGADRC